MSLRLLVVLLVLVTGSAQGVLPFEKSSTTFQRGPFSFGLGVHQTSPEFIYPDGFYLNYPGFVYAGTLDVQIWGRPSEGDVRAFLTLLQGKTQNPHWNSDSLTRTETLFGLRTYVNPMFFLGLGIGQEKLRRTDSNGAYEYQNPVYAMNLGIDVPLSTSTFISLQGWYKSATLKRNQNDSLQAIGNVNFESTEVALSLVWSPSTSYSTPK